MLTIVSHKKLNYVIGFSWRHENDNPAFSYVKSLAVESGAGVAVIRKSVGAWQIGIGNTETGSDGMIGLPSLAAAIADSTIESISLLCKLPEKDMYWYLAIRDGEILPDGDFVGNQYDCMAIRSQYLDLGAWGVSEECDISDAFSYIVSGRQKRDCRTRSALQQFNPVPVIVVVIMLVLGGVGFWFLHKQHQKEMSERAVAAFRARKAAEEREAMKERLIPPWTKHPGTNVLLSYCRKSWAKNTPYNNDWKMKDWSCSIGDDDRITVAVDYVNVGGMADDAPGNLGFGSDATAANKYVSDVLVEHSTTNVSNLMSKDDANREIFTLARNLSSVVHLGGNNLGDRVALPGISSGSGAQKQNMMVSDHFEFSLESHYSPFVAGFGGAFDPVSVTVLKKILWDSKVWRIDGIVYFIPGK